MSDILSIDLETKNFSHEIGGWHNTHMFQVSTVCTWDGDKGVIYIDKAVDELKKSNVEVKPLSQLKFDLDDEFSKGTKLLGHNIAGFDLPVLRDSLDIYCISKYFKHRQYIDTSQLITKACGERIALQNVIDHTLGESKLLESHDAPALWKMGEYDKVIKYCLSDSKLVYDLWIAGKSDTIKAFSINNKEIIDIEVKW